MATSILPPAIGCRRAALRGSFVERARRTIEAPSSRARLALAASSAALFALSFPPFDLGTVLGWVALVPLAIAVRGLTPARAALHGGVFGIVSVHIVFAWMFRFAEFRAYHGLVLGAYLALYPAAIAAAIARFGFTARGLVVVPAIAVAVEWLRGHAGFLAMPWATLAQTQHDNVALLQLAALGGEGLMALFVVAVNVALAQLVTGAPRRAPAVALALAGLAHVYGAIVLRTELEGDEIVVAAVQPAILPKRRDAESFERLLALTRQLRDERPALVVWPETAVVSVEADLETKLAIRDVVEELSAPIVFGSSETEKLVSGTTNKRSFNAAYVMAPRTPVPAPYRKVKLLPFGEYRPIAVPEWLVPSMFDTEAGERRTTLRAGDIVVEPLICWENLFADELRTTATDEPTVIAHVVNDAWFGPTSQPELHNLVSALRAAESGRPLVLSSNTGPSWIIDARGRVVARTPRAFEPAAVTARVFVPGGRTVYRRYGDLVWAVPTLIACVAACALDRARRRREVASG